MPLLIAATPIGNLGDATPRLRAALAAADVIAAEDTRRLRRLLAGLDVRTSARVVSHFDQNEGTRLEGLLQDLRAGRTVVVVTDAGTPLVSDPGYRLLAAATGEGLPVSVVPGVSAVTAALAVAGLPADRWCFEGFPPRRAGERRRLFAQLAAERRTLVFFEAPHRLAATLADLVAEFGGDRRAAVCRELTKTHEEVRRGRLAELATWAEGDVRGEVTLVVAGAAGEAPAADDAVLAAAVADLLAAGWTRRDAVAEVAVRFRVAKRRVWDVAHDARR